LIEEGAVISRYGVGLVVATGVSTVLTLVVTASVFGWAVRRFGPHEEEAA
jgi:holin-like protein